ncbi:sensor histidine kinase [Dongshaea marina]|uniref:sensor histidine kinase n=1 Tax=Dongshaea marina TaxID=2047966 RepID=UPI000D3E7E51|nr:HAMP domain-containing sensor histidine kinase [Dongshaea marina]
MSFFESRLRPRSLLQLILAGFVLVTFPLAFLLYQNTVSLNYLSGLLERNMSESVQQTRYATELTFLSTDMASTIRRYRVLGTAPLKQHYLKQLDHYESLLAQEQLASAKTTGLLKDLLPQLQALAGMHGVEIDRRLDIFIPFFSLNRQLSKEIKAQVDIQVDFVQQQIRRYQNRSWWYLSVLFSLSFLLIMIFTWLIIRPIRKMESMIHSIGSGHDPEPVTMTSPTELVELCERLHWLHNRLNQLEEQKQQFLRHISHELKTPLSSLREGADLLIEQVAGPLNEGQLEIVELMVENGQRLQQLIEQLLGYNRLSQQKQIKWEWVDIPSLIQSVVNHYRLPLANSQIRLVEEIEPVCWYTDSERLRLIIDNLLSNAIHYGKQLILIKVRVEEQQLVLDIANNGTAISTEERAAIFEPFIQGKASRDGPVRGSGLGLSIALESALSLEGQLVVLEEHEMDVCFRLTLLKQGEASCSE